MLVVLVCYCMLLDCEPFMHVNLFLCFPCVTPTFSFDSNKRVLDFTLFRSMHLCCGTQAAAALKQPAAATVHSTEAGC